MSCKETLHLIDNIKGQIREISKDMAGINPHVSTYKKLQEQEKELQKTLTELLQEKDKVC